MMSERTRRAFKLLKQEGPVAFIKKCQESWLLYNPAIARNVFKFYTSKNNLVNRYNYDFPPSPYQTITISPKDIDYILRRNENGYLVIPDVHVGGIGQIRGGDWDSPEYRVEISNQPHDGNMYFVQRFNMGRQIHETDRYKYLVKNTTEDYAKDMGFESVKEYVEDYLESYDDLFRIIKEEGYKPNHDGKSQNSDGWQPIKDKLEPLVTIDRWGNINHWDGQHRQGIARALDIEIPVHVVCRHKKWQDIRDKIYNDGLTEDYGRKLRGHPDLQDVLR